MAGRRVRAKLKHKAPEPEPTSAAFEPEPFSLWLHPMGERGPDTSLPKGDDDVYIVIHECDGKWALHSTKAKGQQWCEALNYSALCEKITRSGMVPYTGKLTITNDL